MRTVYIGAYGFGNLGDELCLLEAMQSFPTDEAFVVSRDPEWTARCVPGIAGFVPDRKVLKELRPDRVVYGGGGIGKQPGLKHFLHWMGDVQQQGGQTHIHNIAVSVARDLSWLDQGTAEIIRRLTSITVRDFKSVEAVLDWGVGVQPGLSQFPERLVEPDMSLAHRLLPPVAGKVLGLSVIASKTMLGCLDFNAAAIRELLEPYRDWIVIPIVSQWHLLESGLNDAKGFQEFERRFLGEFDVRFRETLDRAWWYGNLTPRRLKGLIARCDRLISQRKHNCVHAIGSGTPVIGLNPAFNDSLSRTFLSLCNHLPPDSRFVQLALPPELASAAARTPT